MITSVAHVTIPVADYDEALRWYTDKLGLEVRQDDAVAPGYRWISVGAHGQPDLDLVLHLSAGRVHPEDPGTPLLVFFTDDCRREYARLVARGVRFARPPEDLPWGVQAMLLDPFGNTYVLVQRGRTPATAIA